MGDFSVGFKEQISETMLADLAESVPLSVTGQEGETYAFEAPFNTDQASLRSLYQAIERVTGKDSVEYVNPQGQ